MRVKERMSETLFTVLVIFLFVLFLPIVLLIVLSKLLATPYDYLKYKRSLYQKDFPHRYTWLKEVHTDNEAYTAIKENDLPIKYVRLYEDYDMPGRFLYKDVLLWFYPSLFFSEDKKQWLYWQGNEDEEEYEASEDADDANAGDTDDCGTVEDLKEFLLTELSDSGKTPPCRRIVFFYERKRTLREYGKEALEIMRTLDDFIIYEKGELAKVIKDFIENN